MGQYDLAIRDYDQVIKLDPNIAAGFSGRGETYVFKEQYDRAIQDYDRAIKLDPNDAGYFSGRGNAHLEKGGRDYGFGDGVEYDRAIQDYTQAITLNPNLQCLAGEAITGDCPADEAVAGEVLARDFLQRGRVYFVRRQYDLAIQDYSQAIRLDPNYSYAFILRAAAYYATGQHNRAVQDDDEAVRLIGRQDPMLIHPLIFLGA
jgi:tetratricopeptide (TPR) repeat protein